MGIHFLSKIFNILFKNIFDNQLSIMVQNSSLKLQKSMIDGMFNCRKYDNQETSQRLLIIQILHKIALKLGQIKENFSETINFLKNKYPDLKAPTISKTLYLSQLPKKKDVSDSEWDKIRLEYIENSQINIDNYLFTSSSYNLNVVNSIFENDEELVLNCFSINQNTYLEYFRDIKDNILPLLIENTSTIIQHLVNQQPPPQINPMPQVPNQYFPNANDPKVNGTMPANIGPLNNMCNFPNNNNPRQNRMSPEEIMIMGKLLRNGLEIFEYFHNYKFHDKFTDEKEKMNSITAFMSIFSHITDQNNFKDIIEGNMDIIFKYLLKYAKECFENCLQNFIIHPFFGQNNFRPNQNSWTNFAEILIRHILKKIESTPDVIGPCHPYYEYKDELHYLLQKMIRIPIRSLQKNTDDRFLRPYFKQFVLCLLKKSRILIFSHFKFFLIFYKKMNFIR